jgi:hypothetical protein
MLGFGVIFMIVYWEGESLDRKYRSKKNLPARDEGD